MAEDDEEVSGPAEVILRPEQMAGVWANFATVSHSEHEFTLDFIRLESDMSRGIVVARVSVSPLFITQLIDALEGNWENYASKAMPKEVQHDHDDEDRGSEEREDRA